MHTRLEQALDAAEMSPDTLARRSHTKVYDIAAYLDGKRLPTAETNFRLAAALHVSPSWLGVGEPKTIGDRIRAVRFGLGRSLDTFGADLGVSGDAVSNWEGDRLPSLMTVVTIAETYGISLDWLLLGKGEMRG